ncbi:MAG: hypothetical protein IT376_06920 [Polyangiaceae bacterium]|nr:hypothetical protein [Polyangiaceae bacterium]
MTWSVPDEATAPLREGGLRVVEPGELDVYLAEALGDGMLLARVPRPGATDRGRLALAIEGAVEDALERRGSPPPGVEASADLDGSLSDQLYRARLLGSRGIAVHVPSLAGLASRAGVLDAEDSAVLRWWMGAAAERPLRLLLDAHNCRLAIYGPPVGLAAYLSDGDGRPRPREAERAADQDAVGAAAAADPGADAAPGSAAEESAPPPSTPVLDFSVPLVLDDLAEEAPAPSAARALAALFEDVTLAALRECVEAATAAQPLSTFPPPTVAPLESAPRAEEPRVDAADAPAIEPEASAAPAPEPAAAEPEEAPALAAPGDDDAVPQPEEPAARPDERASETRVPLARVRLVRVPARPEGETSPEPQPEPQPEPTPEEDRARQTVAARRVASSGPLFPDAPSAWRSWMAELDAARGPKPLAVIERLFVGAYVPLADAVDRGVAGAEALPVLDTWAQSFERSYSEAFPALCQRGKRPTMTADVADLAARIGRLHGARNVQLVLVDGLRWDLGLRVEKALAERVAGRATLAERALVWSALPTTTAVQLSLIGRGPAGLREVGRVPESDVPVARGRAAATLRRVRTAGREVLKLDLVEASLTLPGAAAAERLDELAPLVAEALTAHLVGVPGRTLVLVFGDHGFRLDRQGVGTGAARSGRASPDEVLVPALAWLTGEVH